MRLDELCGPVELIHPVLEFLVLLLKHHLDDFSLPLLLLQQLELSPGLRQIGSHAIVFV